MSDQKENEMPINFQVDRQQKDEESKCNHVSEGSVKLREPPAIKCKSHAESKVQK